MTNRLCNKWNYLFILCMLKIKNAIIVVKIIKNWPVIFMDYFNLIKKPYLIKFRNGVKYKVRPKTFDKYIISEIWCHKGYIQIGFQIKDSDLILDIGAHIGVFSIFASRQVKNGKIYAFEPAPENFEMLRENIELNKAKNIIPFNKAVSDKNGKREIYFSSNPADTGGHSFVFASKNKIIVETISLGGLHFKK